MGAKGLYRIKANANGKESVRVERADASIRRLSRRDYEAFGYYPRFEQLPAKEVYEAQNSTSR
jgi:hypothetical protein